MRHFSAYIRSAMAAVNARTNHWLVFWRRLDRSTRRSYRCGAEQGVQMLHAASPGVGCVY